MNIIMTGTLSCKDRGLQYGDGFFTTVQIKAGQLALWSLHIQRLQQCQQRLGFTAFNWQELTDYCVEVAKTHQQAVLKVIITRGVGGRGYTPPENVTPTVTVSVSEFPMHYTQLSQTGLCLGVSNIQLGHQPLLAGLKTLNRLEQVLIKQDAMQFSDDDVVVMDIDNHVVETSVGNIIGYQEGEFYTPKLDKCGIEGVYLKHLAQHNLIKPTQIKLEQLLEMDAVVVCNSLMECMPVSQLGEKAYDLDIVFGAIRKLNNKVQS
ncbi:aminodeoxychorismate lyase [Pseudoalteromonas citrea]|uniref:Aminodeoxychorismate lyase n=1 Tax=Pseudoalteromonas citrea TaxID=43655 RepID=A0A5S3XUI5_9GAMM|nr:aminodeoxychorismate lyase [Pseudoalteromonas citrea]TMP40535.1 aminodeoxychorismate lyase [Pseudoalteromonas citrea]TMP61827.1 aminodeoxychorismate lyase [Pseudoalteromonas citrea]